MLTSAPHTAPSTAAAPAVGDFMEASPASTCSVPTFTSDLLTYTAGIVTVAAKPAPLSIVQLVFGNDGVTDPVPTDGSNYQHTVAGTVSKSRPLNLVVPLS